MKNMKRMCLVLWVAAGGFSVHAAMSRAELWDMTEVRKQPFDFQSAGPSRLAPLVVAGQDDWMNTGDAWVAKKKDAAPSAPGLSSDAQLTVEEFFISSENTPDGPHRIYCAVARPEKATGPVPVVLIFHGGGGHASGALALAAARRHPGMAGLAMDYNGQFAPGPKDKVTQWKRLAPERAFDLVPNLRNWRMYHNVTAARRTIDFLETQPWADARRVGCVGISYGGWLALMLAGVDERIKCVTTGVSAGGAEFTAGRAAQQLRWEPAEQRKLWLEHYEPLAHAPHTRAGVFFQLAANDLYFWLNGASKNIEALPGEKGWVVRPNSNHGAGGPEVPDTAAPAFMRHILAGGAALPCVTDLTADAQGLVYRWKVNGPFPITRAVLTWSPGKAVSPGRYWIEFLAERVGNEWIARLPAMLAGMASEAYVNVGDEAGVVVSSALMVRDGLDPMTTPGPLWAEESLWDLERGAAAWRTPAPWSPKTVFEFAPPAGIRLGPDKGGKEFILLSNSAILAAGRAGKHKGIRLYIDGEGQSGTLKVAFLRDTNSLDEIAHVAEVTYDAGVTTRDIPWGAFKMTSKTAPPVSLPAPFDAIQFSGARVDEKRVTIQAVTLIP